MLSSDDPVSPTAEETLACTHARQVNSRVVPVPMVQVTYVIRTCFSVKCTTMGELPSIVHTFPLTESLKSQCRAPHREE